MSGQGAEDLKRLLVGLRERDRKKRDELIQRRELFLGYHPEMERVHLENAEALERVLERDGWPSTARVGREGSEAAWIVALHAISRPDFQRRCLELLRDAVDEDRADPRQYASLVDRIRYNERRPQVYGTIFDWDESGKMSPWTIEDAQRVDERRATVGLPPLSESVEEQRARAGREADRPTESYRERQAKIEDWARQVGWLPS